MTERKQILTKKGYDFFEASSAFQKSIRRGLEEDALFWGTEFIMSKYDNYLWKRMFVMMSEDVGLANHALMIQMQSLHHSYEFLKKGGSEWQLPTYHAIMLLVRSPKSRIVDWAKGKFLDQYWFRTHDKPIPDYALDIHTRKGRKMGKTIRDFFDEGSIIENQPVIEGEEEYRDWCEEHWTMKGWDSIKAKHKAKLEIPSEGQSSIFD